jgi:catechol 2,3-dioxygenase-like lactoylglutathione lyase family enzyme
MGRPAAKRSALRGMLGALAALALAAPARAAEAEHGRLHHVHLNVSDVAATTAFYGKVFGAVPVTYAGRAPALMAERTFIFMNQTRPPIASSLQTGLIHIGWGGVDGPSEFAWWKAQGIEFYTPLTPFLGGHFMYLYGPDHEVIEIWTVEKHHRLNHVHLLATDPKAVAEWFAKVTNSGSPATQGAPQLGNWNVSYGDVTLHVLPDIAALRPKERTGAIQPTDGAGIDHVAFAFTDLDAAYRRVKALGVPVVRPPAVDATYGLKDFFVRAPNGVLVEMVQAKALPEAAWR